MRGPTTAGPRCTELRLNPTILLSSKRWSKAAEIRIRKMIQGERLCIGHLHTPKIQRSLGNWWSWEPESTRLTRMDGRHFISPRSSLMTRKSFTRSASPAQIPHCDQKTAIRLTNWWMLGKPSPLGRAPQSTGGLELAVLKPVEGQTGQASKRH